MEREILSNLSPVCMKSIDEWMTCDFSVLFSSISVTSGRWVGDIEWMYATKPRLGLKRFPPPADLESGPRHQATSD